MAALPPVPASASCSRQCCRTPLQMGCAPSAWTHLTMLTTLPSACTASALPVAGSGQKPELSDHSASTLFTLSSARCEWMTTSSSTTPGTPRAPLRPAIEEGDFVPTPRRAGGSILQPSSTGAPMAATVAMLGPQRGPEAGARGRTVMAAGGCSTCGARDSPAGRRCLSPARPLGRRKVWGPPAPALCGLLQPKLLLGKPQRALTGPQPTLPPQRTPCHRRGAKHGRSP